MTDAYKQTILKHLATLWGVGRQYLTSLEYEEIRPFVEPEFSPKAVKQRETARMAEILRQIAYPKRGTDEERMSLDEAAKLIQHNWFCSELEELSKFEEADRQG